MGLNEPHELHTSGYDYRIRVKTRVKSVKGANRNYPAYLIGAPPRQAGQSWLPAPAVSPLVAWGRSGRAGRGGGGAAGDQERGETGRIDRVSAGPGGLDGELSPAAHGAQVYR